MQPPLVAAQNAAHKESRKARSSTFRPLGRFRAPGSAIEHFDRFCLLQLCERHWSGRVREPLHESSRWIMAVRSCPERSQRRRRAQNVIPRTEPVEHDNCAASQPLQHCVGHRCGPSACGERVAELENPAANRQARIRKKYDIMQFRRLYIRVPLR